MVRSTFRLFLFIGLSFMLSACATAYYKTESETKLNKAYPILVAPANENSGAEEKNFKKMFELSLAKYGYTLHNAQKNNMQKPCVLLFSLTEPTQDMIGSYTTYRNQTSNTTVRGFVGNTYVYGTGQTTTRTPQTHVYSYQVTYKDIYASIGCPSGSEYSVIWSGYMSAELDDYDSNRENAISNFVRLIDYDRFKGKLRIDTNKHLAHLEKNQKRKHYLTVSGDIGFSMGDMNFGIFHTNSGSLYTDTYDLTDSLALSAPATLRIGYLFDTKKYVAFGLNALYSLDVMSVDYYSYMISAITNRFGLDATMIIADSVLLGIGVAQNFASSAQITIDDYDLYMQTKRKIEATYGLWRLEYMYNIPATNLSLSLGLSGSWSMSDVDYAGSMLALTLGAFYKI